MAFIVGAVLAAVAIYLALALVGALGFIGLVVWLVAVWMLSLPVKWLYRRVSSPSAF